MKEFEQIVSRAIPHDRHEWLLLTLSVAAGYGCSEGAIRNQKSRRSDELIEDIHWLKLPATSGAYKIWWTKRGVIRLGMFLESHRAKIFRDYAESLILGAANNHVVEPHQIDEPGWIVRSPKGAVTGCDKPAAGLSHNDTIHLGQGLQPTELPIYPTKTYKQNHAQRNHTPYTELMDDEVWEEDEEELLVNGNSRRQQPNQNVNVTVIQSNDALTAVWSWAFMTAMACFLFGALILFVAWLPEFMPHRQPSSQEVR